MPVHGDRLGGEAIAPGLELGGEFGLGKFGLGAVGKPFDLEGAVFGFGVTED